MFILTILILLAVITGFFTYKTFTSNEWFLLVAIVTNLMACGVIMMNHVIVNGLISEHGMIGGSGIIPGISLDKSMSELGTIYLSIMFGFIALYLIYKRFTEPKAANEVGI